MKVIGHDTVRDQPHGHAKTCFADQSDEGLVVPRLAEDAGARIAAVQDVIAVPLSAPLICPHQADKQEAAEREALERAKRPTPTTPRRPNLPPKGSIA
jgi:hypothetical protein